MRGAGVPVRGSQRAPVQQQQWQTAAEMESSW